MITRVAPAVLALLGDGMPRRRRAIVAALAERHPKDEVARTLMRLAVTGRPRPAASTPSHPRTRQAGIDPDTARWAMSPVLSSARP
jgi:hypothetical protein